MFRFATAFWCALAAPAAIAAHQGSPIAPVPTAPVNTTASPSAQTPTEVIAKVPTGLAGPASQRPFQAGPRNAPDTRPPFSSRARDGANSFSLIPADAPSPVATVEKLDDAIPLPNPRVVKAGPQGDVVVEPASGDPFFLGFAAGKYFPPAGEYLDPLLVAGAQTNYSDGRPTPETYAFAMLEKRITPARVAELEALGARVLGTHPYNTLKLALPAGSIDSIAQHPDVHWLGSARPWQKVHPALATFLAGADPNYPVEVWINLFESDLGPNSTPVMSPGGYAVAPDGSVVQTPPTALANVWVTHGWMQNALEGLGVQVLDYSDRIQAHRALMMPQALESVVALDFVQFVEWRPPARTMHDESMAMINADDTRNFWNGGDNSRTVTGVVDSGIEVSHAAILGIWGMGWDESGAGDPWSDGCNHGTHVSGTVFGHDPANPSLHGVAPGLGWGATGRIFNVRIFSTCSGSVSVSTILGHTGTSFNDGTNITPRPHVTNNSWGSGPGPGAGWIGSEGDPRLYDDNAWAGAQLNVFAAGNDGSGAHTVGQEASAKNVLTVASVLDYNDPVEGPPGSIRSTSSRGPCGDGRWKPNVCAPGRWIRSADATNLNGYMDDSGTSMASPHVTGLISDLIDWNSGFTYLPERICAHVMATTVPKDDFLYSSPSDSPLDNYGTGRVDGTRAAWGSGGSNSTWGFTLGSGASTYADFTVPANATRLIAVMTCVEQSSSAGASQALVNNWDLYLDQPPVDTSSNGTGDWFLQQSSIDNSEIRVLSNPIAGTWRWKVWPTSTVGTGYFGVTIYVLTADTAPIVALSVTANDYYVKPNVAVDITASTDTSGATASAVFLNSTSAGDVLTQSSTTLMDGAVTNLMTNQHSGRDVELGNLDPFFGRSATWRTSWASEGVKTWSVTASGDNFVDPSDSVNITVDGTPPALVGNLHSTSHTVNVWSNNPVIDFAWNAATDNLSGVQGYGVSWGNAPGVFVANAIDTAATTYTTPAFASNAAWYFAVKTTDNCDNWTAGTSEVGPYKIDTVVPVAPGVLSSPSHTVNVQSCSTVVTVNWAAASDALSGLVGYLGVWNTTAVFDPTGVPNLPNSATTSTVNIGSATLARYYHLRAKDNAGNYSTTRHFGPVYANASSVATYCTGKTNSLGCVPAIGTNGVQPDKSAGTFTVNCVNVINQKNGLLFWGRGQIAVPFQGGTLCVMAPTVRTLNISSGGATSGSSCTGSYAFNFSTAYMNANAINPGDTIYCQWWMRDPPSPSTTGLSNAIHFTVCQ